MVPRQREESTASADQRCFDRATSQHVYIPWSLIHEIFCQTRRLCRSSCDVPVAEQWGPRRAHQLRQEALFLDYHKDLRRGAAATLCNGAVAATWTATRRKRPAAENLAAEMLEPSGDVEQGETVVPVVER